MTTGDHIEGRYARKKYVLIALCFTLLCFGAVEISSAAELRTHKNSIGMEFVLIPAGSFMMGMGSDVAESRPHERPQPA